MEKQENLNKKGSKVEYSEGVNTNKLENENKPKTDNKLESLKNSLSSKGSKSGYSNELNYLKNSSKFEDLLNSEYRFILELENFNDSFIALRVLSSKRAVLMHAFIKISNRQIVEKNFN